MDAKLFISDAPGELLPVKTPWGADNAFLPAPLPPDREMPVGLWPLLSDVKQHLGILEGIGRTLPNPAILLRPLADREAIRSSRLEGTYATPRELLLYELEPRLSTSERDPANDQREVYNYRRALNHGLESELPISLRLICELHSLLLSGVRGRDRKPGVFRTVQVAIGVAGRFVPPPPERVGECMQLLEKYIHADGTPFDPLVDSFFVHYQFEAIHPFNDGNGRVGRLLLAMMLQQRCGLSRPWLYLSEFFERHRDDYIRHLFNVSARGDWTAWVEFCLQGTLAHARETAARCQRLLTIRETFMQRIQEAGGSIRLNQIVENIFHSPFVRVADLPGRLGVTYPTAKADTTRLVEAGILEELPDVYPKTYYAPEVFSVAYEELDDPAPQDGTQGSPDPLLP